MPKIQVDFSKVEPPKYTAYQLAVFDMWRQDQVVLETMGITGVSDIFMILKGPEEVVDEFLREYGERVRAREIAGS